ncbi:MAG TPA: hypothetical protein VGM94_04140 [Galbitalea sp.]|jgi:hypothetical protein
MNEQSETWTLHRGGEIIAELRVKELDTPWLTAEISRLPGFEAVEPFFVEDLKFLERPDPDGDDVERWEQLCDNYMAGTTLVKPSGEAVAEFLLHIEGDEARWRRSDTAFG